MIKVKKGKFIGNGSTTELLSDFTVIVRSLKKGFVDNGVCDEEQAKKMLEKSFSLAFKTDEELREEALDSIKKVIERLGEVFGEATDKETEDDPVMEGEKDNGSEE